MGASARAKRFVRTDIPAAEKWVGGGCLLLLLGIGWAVYDKGQNYDPGVYEVDTAALATTADAVVGMAATLPGENASTGPGSAAQPAAGLDRLLPEFGLPLKAMGPTEIYTPDTLFEKINGRAPAYLEFNFRELTSRSFSLTMRGGQFIDVFIYWMDTPLNAYGMFSLERDPSGEPVEFAPDGYASEMGYFYRTGRAYVQIIASSADAEVMDVAQTYAGYLAGRLPADDVGLEARSSLPAYGQVPDSVAFVARNAYGQSLLKNVFQASYQFRGAALNYFAMQADDAQAGAAAWQALHDFNAKFGQIGSVYELAGAQVFTAENFGEYTVAAHRDGMVCGIMSAGDLSKAKQFVAHVLRDDFPEAGGTAVPVVAEPGTEVGEEGYE